MKRNNLFKIIFIAFMIFVVGTWIFSTGTFSGTEFVKADRMPLGIAEIFIYPVIAIQNYINVGIAILFIGALYGVLNKTGIYQKIVGSIAKKFEGKEKVFLILTIGILALLSSFTTASLPSSVSLIKGSLVLPILMLVPFFVTVILLLGYKKMTALLSTFGAMLVGNMASICGVNYLYAYFGLKTNENLLIKIITFVFVLAILIIFVLRTSKLECKKEAKKGRKKKEEVEAEIIDIPLYTECESNDKKSLATIIVLLFFTVLLFVGMFDWQGVFGIEKTIFQTWHANLLSTKINGYPLFQNLFGSFSPFGSWGIYELLIVLPIMIITVGLVGKLKLKDIFDSAVEGMKEILPVAAIAVLVNAVAVVSILAIEQGGGTIWNGFYHSLLGSKFNALGVSVSSLIGTFGFNDIYYLVYSLNSPISAYSKSFGDILFIIQVMFGFGMFILPTSFILMTGLKYLNVSYKEWFKENYKLLLCILLSAFIMILAITLI